MNEAVVEKDEDVAVADFSLRVFKLSANRQRDLVKKAWKNNMKGWDTLATVVVGCANK